MSEKPSDVNTKSSKVLGRGQPDATSPDASDDYTTADAARDLLHSGDTMGAGQMVAGKPEALGRVQVPAKRRPGRPAGRSFEEKVTFTIDRALLERLQAEADALHTSRAAVIRGLLRDGLDVDGDGRRSPRSKRRAKSR